MHLLSTSSTSLDDIVEPVDLGQTPGDIAILSFADSDLAGFPPHGPPNATLLAERAAGAVARSQASDVGRSLDRAGRVACQGDRRAAARRSRLVALRRRSAFRAGEGARHRARHAAGRGPRRSAACRMLDAAAGRIVRAARIFPRGRARQSPRPAAPAVAPCRLRRSISTSRSRCRASAAPRPPGRPSISIASSRRCLKAGRSSRSCSIARCCWPPTSRRSTRSARRCPRAALRRRRCSSRASRIPSRRRSCAMRCGGSRLRSSSPPRRLPRATAQPVRRSTRPACRCCRPSSRPPSAPPGSTARAGSARPTLRCMSCCPNSTAACWPARSRSRIRPRRSRACRSPAWPTGPSPTGSTRIADRVAAWAKLQTHSRGTGAASRC